MGRIDKYAAVATAAPALMIAGARGLALILAAFGHHPMWPEWDLNLSEAAAVRDDAEVVRWIEQGQDSGNKLVVRSGLLFDYPVSLTPLEAAAAAGNANTINLLFRAGAVLEPEDWSRLRCEAERSDVVETLEAHRPSGAELRCTGTESEVTAATSPR